MNSRVDSINRFMLFLLGLLALAGGIIILLLTTFVFGKKWANQPMLQQQTRRFADHNAGWFWTVIAIGSESHSTPRSHDGRRPSVRGTRAPRVPTVCAVGHSGRTSRR